MSETVLMFLLARQRLALPAMAVRECLPLPLLWRRPGLPASVAGFFSLGGRVLPVVDLARLLGLRGGDGSDDLGPGDLYRHLIHLGEVALLVDRITGFEVLGEALDETHAGLGAEPWQHGCVLARFLAGGEPVALLDPARILLEDERTRLAALTVAAEQRAGGWRDAG